MKRGLGIVLLAGALALSGCGGDSEATPEAAPLSQETAEVTAADAAPARLPRKG